MQSELVASLLALFESVLDLTYIHYHPIHINHCISASHLEKGIQAKKKSIYQQGQNRNNEEKKSVKKGLTSKTSHSLIGHFPAALQISSWLPASSSSWALAGLRPAGPRRIVGRVQFLWVNFSRLASRLRRSARREVNLSMMII